MSRTNRFLHLERARAETADEADPSPATAERFGGVERPTEEKAPAAPRSSGAELGRFGPAPEPALELADTAAGERPFTRCMGCGMDHNVSATECSNCSASLDTAAQREFNAQLWATRQEESAREAAAEAERKVLAARAEAELAAAQRAMHEELAREVGRRERARLGAELGGDDGFLTAGRLLSWVLRLLGGLLGR